MRRAEASTREASCRGCLAHGEPCGGSRDRGPPVSPRGIADTEPGDV